MAYSTNTPLGNQKLSVSQPELKENFDQLNQFLIVNHGQFGGLNAGLHEKVVMPSLVSDPATGGQQVALYSKMVGVDPHLFLRPKNSGTAIDLMFAVKSNNGETTLPSGIKLKWGRGTTNSSGFLTQTFASLGLTNFTTIYSFQATAATATLPGDPDVKEAMARVNIFNTTEFKIQVRRVAGFGNPGIATGVTWFAIGV